LLAESVGVVRVPVVVSLIQTNTVDPAGTVLDTVTLRVPLVPAAVPIEVTLMVT
jgi:hypothetical protein